MTLGLDPIVKQRESQGLAADDAVEVVNVEGTVVHVAKTESDVQGAEKGVVIGKYCSNYFVIVCQ